LTSFRRRLDRGRGLGLPVFRGHELDRHLLQLQALERRVVHADGKLDGAIEIRSVGRETAGERQDVADPELKRASLLRRFCRRGSAGDPGHGRDSGQHHGGPHRLPPLLHGSLPQSVNALKRTISIIR